MSEAERPLLGPAVRAVVSDDPLVPAGPVMLAPGSVAHLRTERPGRDILLLHHAGDASDVIAEIAERIMWLDGRAGTPELIASGRADKLHETAVIRMQSMAMCLADPMQPVDPESVARMLGAALRDLHSIDTSDCPFDSSTDAWRQAAADRIAAGLVEPETTGPYARQEPDRLHEILDELFESVGTDPDESCVIHGWPTSPHIWFQPDGTIAFTGWQKCGLGDRHHDLAIAAASLSDRYGPAVVPVFLDSYGLDRIDISRLDLHQLLAHLAGITP